jgi:hypothetical protein
MVSTYSAQHSPNGPRPLLSDSSGDRWADRRSRYPHVQVEPVDPQVLVTTQGTQISPRQANAVHKVLEARVGA